MPPLFASILDQLRATDLLDIGITALLIYWVFSLIRGTSAVRLVIGVTLVFAVYFVARFLALRLLTQILETSAVVGLFALVVVFQPELRRALDRIGRVGSLAWLVSADDRVAETVASEVARAAAAMSAEGHGALMVIERETGLEQIAETGVMIHGDLSADLMRTIFSPRSPLHDGAVIIRGSRIIAAGAVLPLSETSIQSERFGTRHRAALGTTEQTDAIVVVVSEENGHVSLVQKARIVRNLNENQLGRALRSLLEPSTERGRLRIPGGGPGSPSRRLPDIGRAVRTARRDGKAGSSEPIPPAEPMAPEPAPLPRPGDSAPAASANVGADAEATTVGTVAAEHAGDVTAAIAGEVSADVAPDPAVPGRPAGAAGRAAARAASGRGRKR